MKTGETAKIMGVNPKTVINWVDQPGISQFLSETARRDDTTTGQRDFNNEDLFVLNTIRLRKNRRNSWGDVVDYLATGKRDTELPESSFLVRGDSKINQLSQLMMARSERDIALAQNHDLMVEIERIRDEYIGREDNMRREMQEQDEKHKQELLAREDQHKKELMERERAIGRLEAQIEMLKEQKGKGGE